MAVAVTSCTTGRPVMSAPAPAPEVTVETFEVSVTSMPPRRALMELEAELARAYRPRLYLVQPLADPDPASPLAD